MHVDEFLRDSVVLLSSAVLVVFLSARARVPALIGLILTGMLVGPTGLQLIHDVEKVEVFAEIGVVLLLFIIGLELDLSQLRALRTAFLLGGGAQTVLTTLLTLAIVLPLLQHWQSAVFVSLAVALSSTAVVLKLYGERRELRTPQGRTVLGILLFQDFLIVPLIVVTPILSGASEASPADLAWRLGGSIVVVAAVIAAARLAVPLILHQVSRVKVRELFVLTGLATSMALSWLTYSLGFSLALGAFLAGLLVSESEYAHQLVSDMVPFRDVFASVFFVSVGMLVDLSFAASRAWLLLAVAVGLIAIKTVAAALATLAIRYPLRIAVISGLGLAQIGEFSFVLMELGRSQGLLGDELFQTLLSASVLTLLAAPALIRVAPAAGRIVAERLSRGVAAPDEPGAEDLRNHVIVCGFGSSGRLLASVLRKAHVDHVIVELNALTVRQQRDKGWRIGFGDVTRREILEHAGIETAEAIVFAISDRAAVRRGVRLARALNPSVEIIVRAHSVEEIGALRALGADDVIAEEFETAIEIFTRVLRRFHVPRNIVRAQTRALRGEDYEMLRVPSSEGHVSAQVIEALEAGTTDLYRIEGSSHVVGKSIAGLDLRRQTGATIIAVVRGEEPRTNPSPDLILESGDCLVLVGSHAEIDQAFVYLDRVRERGPSTA